MVSYFTSPRQAASQRSPSLTLSVRQREMRREWVCDGYIHVVSHTLEYPSHLIALGKISVNRTEMKGHEWILSLLKLLSTLSRSSRTRVWMSTFVRTSSHSHLAVSLDKYPWWKCKPSISSATRVSRVPTFAVMSSEKLHHTLLHDSVRPHTCSSVFSTLHFPCFQTLKVPSVFWSASFCTSHSLEGYTQLFSLNQL